MGIQVDFVNFHKEDQVREKLVKGSTKLMWLETPTNPTLRVTDIQQVAVLARENGCLLAVDNTFCSPYFQTPFDFGADIGTYLRFVGPFGYNSLVLSGRLISPSSFCCHFGLHSRPLHYKVHQRTFRCRNGCRVLQ